MGVYKGVSQDPAKRLESAVEFVNEGEENPQIPEHAKPSSTINRSRELQNKFSWTVLRGVICNWEIQMLMHLVVLWRVAWHYGKTHYSDKKKEKNFQWNSIIQQQHQSKCSVVVLKTHSKPRKSWRTRFLHRLTNNTKSLLCWRNKWGSSWGCNVTLMLQYHIKQKQQK